MNYTFEWGTISKAWPYLVEGMVMTLFLVAVAMLLGIVVGTLLAICKLFGPSSLKIFVNAYVNIFRSIPLILTILWFYFLMPPIFRLITGDQNLTVGAIYSALAAFTLAESAYYCEIMRAGISSVRGGQTHAAMALGMTRWQALHFVVLPQAFRNMMPSLINQTIALFKDTSLVYVISLNDFLGAASKLGQRDGRLVEMYLFAAIVYLVICSVGVWFVGLIQKHRLQAV